MFAAREFAIVTHLLSGGVTLIDSGLDRPAQRLGAGERVRSARVRRGDVPERQRDR